MIYGIGTDIVKCERFLTWVNDEKKCKRFFNESELLDNNAPIQRKIEHLSGCFAAKEAFVKALGTGFVGMEINEISVENNSEGKPSIRLCGKAESILKNRVGDCNIQLSISHEKDFAVAFVIIEKF